MEVLQDAMGGNEKEREPKSDWRRSVRDRVLELRLARCARTRQRHEVRKGFLKKRINKPKALGQYSYFRKHQAIGMAGAYIAKAKSPEMWWKKDRQGQTVDDPGVPLSGAWISNLKTNDEKELVV